MTPVATGHRMSKLPITQYCGLAGKLSDEAGSVRPGVMSKWFHANCGEQWAEAGKLWTQLTEEEREDVKGWIYPADCYVSGQHLEYKRAEKELEVTLLDNGTWGNNSPAVMSLGHLDMAWNFDGVAYVGDIKRGRFTVKDGTNSLQLHAYGFAYSSMRKCHSYHVGIWQAMEGIWIWSNRAVDLESSEAADIWDRVKNAATNMDLEASKGAHCQQCWGRMHCPVYLLPAAMSTTELAPLAQGGSLTTEEEALKILQYANALRDLANSATDAVQAAVQQRGWVIRDPATGLTYKPLQCKGRESVKVAELRRKFGEEAESLIKRGRDYDRWDWFK